MKINAIKIYQAVSFANKLETSFNLARPEQANLNMGLLEGIGVSVVNNRDRIIIPFANIASIHYQDTVAEKAQDQDTVAKKTQESSEPKSSKKSAKA
jgi:hypothetical protein